MTSATEPDAAHEVGYGTIARGDVCIFSQDTTVVGGSVREVYGEEIVTVQDLAIKTGAQGKPGPRELNPWASQSTSLRYDVTSWQSVSLLERTHMRQTDACAEKQDS
ncbi:carboxyl transferase domain-containing protein [Mycobacterium sp. pW049]|uniref:carboxyl transferase domain-containing protein n=1 Tax=[Mycobacterium] bulgaricum TaxID=3238985 RepID=UPI00351B5DB6